MDNQDPSKDTITPDQLSNLEQTPSPIQEDIRPSVGAPEGNHNAEKWGTPELRKQLLNAYCEHVKSGLSQSCFVECDMKTFKNYRAKYPIEFPSDVIEAAEREGAKLWEKIGVNGTVGKLAGFNAMSWKFNMQNRYKWKDRTDQTSDDEKIDNKTIVYMPTKLPAQEEVKNEQE